MIKRRHSSGSLLPQRSRSFDHGITATLLILFGVISLAIGGTMTGLAYLFEKRPNFTSAAENYGFRCDIAGPVVLAFGGVCIFVAIFMISVFGVCSKPEWTTHEVSHTTSANSHGLAEDNSPQSDGRFLA